ncbi:MAG: metal-dependent hydrolase [Myxococcaceae bacterium]|nr:metal-dependent hydrolase [Myxococcaceae bacterium]
MTSTSMQTARQSALAVGATREIEPRNVKFPFAADTPKYWFDNDPYQTHVMNALSMIFPEGERYFIAAVRSLREYVTDPTLERQVRGFLGQEALHRREHDAFNDWLRSTGVEVDKFYADMRDALKVDDPPSSKRWRLAITCALEHFTAIIAEEWLTRTELRESAHPNVQPLWSWHAMEELDHKAVAFDVYRAAGGTYTMRAVSMVLITIGFAALASSFHVRLMAHDKQLFNFKSWLKGSWKCWGPRGYFTSLAPAWLRYFSRDFHPWQQDDTKLIETYEKELMRFAVTSSSPRAA